MKKLLIFLLSALLYLSGSAFCGFYVAKVDANLFNNTSEVILVRKANETVITMKNDYEGDLQNFAMIVPVPEVIKKDKIRIANPAIFQKLHDYSGPRLVEYNDEHPCMKVLYDYARSARADGAGNAQFKDNRNQVTVLESYTVGEYDIVVLSARQSDGLATWLVSNGYKIPEKAGKLLQPYVRNGMKFFVVKVNLKEQAQVGGEALRPIQLRFNSDKFVLPIRLGMANAKGSQDMLVYAFTAQGRVTSTNYRTVEIPTNIEIPEFIEEEFQPFYKALFENAYRKAGKNVIFTEYAWNLNSDNFVKCDPCATTPPALAELEEAGVSWLERPQNQGLWAGSDYQGNLHFTRLHVRYDHEHFPQDLQFQVTPNKENFQGRYVINHPQPDDPSLENCDNASGYYADVVERRKQEMIDCEKLTGWDLSDRFLTYVGPYELLRNKYEKDALPFIPEPWIPAWPIVLMLSLGVGLWFLIRRVRLVLN